MKYIKKKIVIGLESACELTGHRWCFKLAGLSVRLDRRWRTGLWREVEDEDNE
jgi:hypothetical protein